MSCTFNQLLIIDNTLIAGTFVFGWRVRLDYFVVMRGDEQLKPLGFMRLIEVLYIQYQRIAPS